MNELKPEPPELAFTVTVTRKATGKVETFDMVGHVISQPEIKENDDDCHA
jgi:hypothetical protein